MFYHGLHFISIRIRLNEFGVCPYETSMNKVKMKYSTVTGVSHHSRTSAYVYGLFI